MLLRTLTLSLFLLVSAQANSSPSNEGASSSKTSSAKVQQKATAKKGAKKMTSNPIVEIHTTMGTMTAEIYQDKAPLSAANFLKYVEEGFYTDTIFHRIIKDFMVQGGGFNSGMKQKSPHPPIKNEATNGLTNQRGTLAMARTTNINSATSQFFINHKDNDFLNHRGLTGQTYGYAVFGKLTSGEDVLDKLAAVKTGQKSGFQDVPVEDVMIQKIVIKK